LKGDVLAKAMQLYTGGPSGLDGAFCLGI